MKSTWRTRASRLWKQLEEMGATEAVAGLERDWDRMNRQEEQEQADLDARCEAFLLVNPTAKRWEVARELGCKQSAVSKLPSWQNRAKTRRSRSAGKGQSSRAKGSAADRERLADEYLAAHPGARLRDLADHLGCSASTAGKLHAWRERAARRAQREQEQQERAREQARQSTPPPARSCWEVLGIAPTNDRETIKSAYRRLCLIHHPDRGGNPADFIRLRDAYERAMALAASAA